MDGSLGSECILNFPAFSEFITELTELNCSIIIQLILLKITHVRTLNVTLYSYFVHFDTVFVSSRQAGEAEKLMQTRPKVGERAESLVMAG